VIAPHDRKEPPRIGESSLLDVFDPGAVDADRNLMLRLTCDRASVAADTFTVVDYETEIHTESEMKVYLICRRSLYL